jgi:hypothetical protein
VVELKGSKLLIQIPPVDMIISLIYSFLILTTYFHMLSFSMFLHFPVGLFRFDKTFSHKHPQIHIRRKRYGRESSVMKRGIHRENSIFAVCMIPSCELVSSVSIVSDYRLDGRGSIPNRDRIFLLVPVLRLALGPTQPPIQWVLGALPHGWSVAGAWCWPLTPS